MAVDQSQPALFTFEALIRSYYRELDEAVSLLSHGVEPVLAFVSPLILERRRIQLGITGDGLKYAIRVDPQPDLAEDAFEVVSMRSDGDLGTVIYPSVPTGGLAGIPSDGSILFQGARLTVDQSPLDDDIAVIPGMVGFGPTSDLVRIFGAEAAKSDAIDVWNSAVTGLDKSGSFVAQAKSVFARLASMIKLKAFKERRVHRFINGHSRLLLPDHQEVFFEYELTGKDESRVADFVLRRDVSMPALLVELESPVHPVVTRSGDWTYQVNHARGQIDTWERLIDSFPDMNANEENKCGDMTFLRGRRDRLVVIGRGLEASEEMKGSSYGGTMIWTYEMLIKEAKSRWSGILSSQRALLGLPSIEPF